MILPDEQAVFDKWMRGQPVEVRRHWARMKNKAQARAYAELNTVRVQYKPTSKYDGCGRLICVKKPLRQRLQDFVLGCVRNATR